MVEYGAGFFVERNQKEATDFYTRKITLIKEKITKLQEIIAEKRESLRNIEIRIYSLIQQQQAQEKKVWLFIVSSRFTYFFYELTF